MLLSFYLFFCKIFLSKAEYFNQIYSTKQTLKTVIFPKGNNSCDFLFAFPYTSLRLKRGLLLVGRILLQKNLFVREANTFSDISLPYNCIDSPK